MSCLSMRCLRFDSGPPQLREQARRGHRAARGAQQKMNCRKFERRQTNRLSGADLQRVFLHVERHVTDSQHFDRRGVDSTQQCLDLHPCSEDARREDPALRADKV